MPEYEDLFKGLSVKDSPDSIGIKMVSGINSNLLSTETFQFNPQSFQQQYESSKQIVLGSISKFRVAHLDSSTRLNLALSCASFNPNSDSPQNLLQNLYLDKDIERLLQQAFLESFEHEIKLDYSELQSFCLRVAKELPQIPKDPQEAYPITKNLSKIDEQGDGYRSFVGIVLGLLLSKDRIILLDEPEAFLHPAQARYLGKWIVDNSDKFDGQLIISTHNSNLLSGILSKGNAIDIYRLNRKENKTTYNLISAETNTKLSKSPILSSQRVLESIFHKGVVICEADADRALYQGVASVELNNQEILFIHAHNKQTIKDIATVLKDSKIPTCAIADIDILNSKEDLKKLLDSLSDSDSTELLKHQIKIIKTMADAPESEIFERLKKSVSEFQKQLGEDKHTLSGAKSALKRIEHETTKWAVIKDKGISEFPKEVSSIAHSIVNNAKKQGLFIVPVGELEGWIDFGTKQKNKWIIPALEVVYAKKTPKELIQFVKEGIDYINNQ